MERFANIVNSFKISVKHPTLDVWKGSEYVSASVRFKFFIIPLSRGQDVGFKLLM